MAKLDVLAGVFRKYSEAHREFLEVMQRCCLKGWPDRKPGIVNACELQRLFNEQQALRFEYWLASGQSDEGAWVSVNSISRRLRQDWGPLEEQALSGSNARYREIAAEIERRQAALDSDVIREPLDAARRDPEYVAALSSIQEALRQLDSQLVAE